MSDGAHRDRSQRRAIGRVTGSRAYSNNSIGTTLAVLQEMRCNVVRRHRPPCIHGSEMQVLIYPR